MLHNYKKAHDLDVQKWLFNSIELTPYQKERIRNDEIIRFAPFEFYKRRERVKNIFVRLSIIAMPIVWCLLVISSPFKFIISGSWGYKYEHIKWFHYWQNAVGI